MSKPATIGFRATAPFSRETSTVNCSQRYFQCAFEQISTGTSEPWVVFSGQRLPRVCALQAGFAGSAPAAQNEITKSIGIDNHAPAAISPGSPNLIFGSSRTAILSQFRGQCQVLRYQAKA